MSASVPSLYSLLPTFRISPVALLPLVFYCCLLVYWLNENDLERISSCFPWLCWLSMFVLLLRVEKTVGWWGNNSNWSWLCICDNSLCPEYKSESILTWSAVVIFKSILFAWFVAPVFGLGLWLCFSHPWIWTILSLLSPSKDFWIGFERFCVE